MYISWEFMGYVFDISNIMITCNIRDIMVIHGDTMGKFIGTSWRIHPYKTKNFYGDMMIFNGIHKHPGIKHGLGM